MTPIPVDAGWQGASPRRPGLLLAIGIVSIVVGLISIVASGFTAHFWAHASANSTPTRVVMVPTGPALPRSRRAPYSGITSRPNGLGADDCARVLNGVTSLSPVRRMLLDSLLAETGRRMFPTGRPAPLTPDPAYHTDPYYQLAGVGFTIPGLPGAKVIVTDQIATFSPGPGVNAQGNSFTVWEDAVEQPAWAGPRFGWPVRAIDRDLARLKRDHPSVTPMQQAYVADVLLAMFPPLYDLDVSIPNCVENAGVDSAGVLHARLSDNECWVLPDGRWTGSAQGSKGIDPMTGVGIPVSFTPLAAFRPLFPEDPAVMQSLAVYCEGSSWGRFF